MAAAKADQVADISSSRQPAAPICQASDAPPSTALVTHTPAPEQCASKESTTPPDSTLQGSAEEAPFCSPEGTGGPDSLPGQARAAPGDGLTPSAVSNTCGSGCESAASVKEADSPATRQEEEAEDVIRGPPTHMEDSLHSTDARQEHVARDDDVPDGQLVTDPHEGAPDVGAASGGVTGNSDEGRSQRSVRMPLAALQEAVAPKMGSLSFKQAVHAKQCPGELLVLHDHFVEDQR